MKLRETDNTPPNFTFIGVIVLILKKSDIFLTNLQTKIWRFFFKKKAFSQLGVLGHCLSCVMEEPALPR